MNDDCYYTHRNLISLEFFWSFLGVFLENNKQQQRQGLYHFGAFYLDPVERRLWRENKILSLEPKQFDLLFYFVKNAGRVARKSELLDAVWEDTNVEETTLARNISWLRKLLEAGANGEKFIETVPKFGYRFSAEVTRPVEKENHIIVEEQITHHFRGEEIITTDNVSANSFGDVLLVKDSDSLKEGEKDNENLIPPKVAPFPRRSYSLSFLILAVLAAITLAVTGFIIYQNKFKVDPRIISTTDGIFVKAKVTVKNISVDATRETLDTGIKVQPGDVITISADGKHRYGTDEIWTYEGNKMAQISDAHAFQKADPWSLVGWVGNELDKTDYFQVSKASPFTANKSGFLYFAVNDWKNEYSNNRGGLNVTVMLTRASRIYAQEGDIKAAWGNELVNLTKGDTLSMTAAGKVSYWIGGEFYDLEGSDHQLEGLLAPKINARSLIGKIGSGNPFKIGVSYPLQRVNQTGWLFFSVNEQIREPRTSAFINNSGDISVDIEITRSAEEFKNPL